MIKNQKISISSWQMESGDPGMWRRGETGKGRERGRVILGEGIWGRPRKKNDQWTLTAMMLK